MNPRPYSHFFIRLLAIVLAFSVCVAVSAQKTAVASLISCRSDPLVILSNGTVLDISADIDTLLTNVEEVHYTLHIPTGLSVVAALSTPNWPTTVETFTVYADQSAGKYSTTTTVETTTSNTAVTANFLVNLTYRTTSGFNGQALTVSIGY